MLKVTASRFRSRNRRLRSFTLVELLTVMTIIAILCALVLYASSGVWTKASRSRAASEIQAISAACEAYKTDNGVYPYTNAATSFGMGTAANTLLTNSTAAPYFSTTKDGTDTVYRQTFQVLYLSLSGQTNFTDTPVGNKVYMTFSRGQIGDPTGTVTGASYIQDPWGNSYGYSTGTAASYPYNGTGFFDLWSTGGVTKSQVSANNLLTNSWVGNWR